jgi:hypothetical protein
MMRELAISSLHLISSARPATEVAMGMPAWPNRDSVIGAPISAVAAWAISSVRSASFPASIPISAPRSCGVLAAQDGKAVRAAATAESASAADPSGTVATGVPIAGLVTGMPLPAAGTTIPSIQWPVIVKSRDVCVMQSTMRCRAALNRARTVRG